MTASRQKKALEKQINLGKQKNEELEKRLSYIQGDDFVQKEAKDKLGLAEPNEIAYIVPDLPDLESLEQKKEYVPDRTNIEQWLDKFIY